MVTKYNTGDVVYVPVRIDKAESRNGEIYYTVQYPSDGTTIPRIIEEDLVVKSDTKTEEDNKLSSFSTCELSMELEKREGVSVIFAEPYQDVKYAVNGPATILIVTD